VKEGRISEIRHFGEGIRPDEFFDPTSMPSNLSMPAKMKAPPSKVSGTKEWAKKNANVVAGCAHDCHYCYAKSMAIRFGRKTPKTWHIEKPKPEQIEAVCSGKPCRVMFPTTHDITPKTLAVCLKAIRKLLEYGHEVLIVTKPHLECIQAICSEFPQYRHKILFRFTIGSKDDGILKFWEPHAPSFKERFRALRWANSKGFQTSVSCEPMLDDNVEALVKLLHPYVSDAIWIGKANRLRQNLAVNKAGTEVLRRGDKLIASQNDDRIHQLYRRLEKNPKVKWKESIKKVVRLKVATKVGLDI